MITTKPYQILSILNCCILLVVLNGCATPDKQLPTLSPAISKVSQVSKNPVKPPTQPVKPDTNIKEGLIVIGEIEPVTIITTKSTFPARIDTGATTSSIDAQQIVRFERDGKNWVRFNVKNRTTSDVQKLESKISRIVEIKRHGADSQNRIVVKLKTKIGSKKLNAEYSLADRSSFKYPVLVGRNILEGNFLVDVSKKNTTSLMNEKK
ncbi:MAG: RimK/LysX family protein [Desulfotalea sp.]